MMEKLEHHKAPIVHITELLLHPNADTLEIVQILGYQVVVKKGQYKVGDLAVYLFPDSVVPQIPAFAWLWEGYMEDVVPERKRRITVRKFRKEYSEGLLTPIREVRDLLPEVLTEGMDVSDALGVTHWEGETEGDTFGRTASAPKQKRRPKTVMGWLRYFYYNTLRVLSFGKMYRRESSMEVKFDAPEYDVVSAKAARSGFQNTEYVVITEKLHGSNGRFLFLDGVFYIGSHFQWKAPDTPCIFTRVVEQRPWIKAWCEANPGRILYGEIIGDQKGYTYGLKPGELDFKAFDIWEPNGTWTKPWSDGADPASTLHSDRIVPLLYTGIADIEKIKELTDGKSALHSGTQREGVVLSEVNKAPEGVRRPRQLKRVSNVFLEKDSAEPKK
jgi:hypothetical protein